MREWVKFSYTPSVFRHTWGETHDGRATRVEVGALIPFDKRTECLTIFYGKPITCPCGLFDLMRLRRRPTLAPRPDTLERSALAAHVRRG